MAIERVIKFKVSADGKVTCNNSRRPQLAGVQGENKVCRLDFDVSEIWSDAARYFLEFVLGGGTPIITTEETDEMTVDAEQKIVSFTLGNEITNEGGQVEIHLVEELLDADSNSSVEGSTYVAFIYFRSKREAILKAKENAYGILREVNEKYDEMKSGLDKQGETIEYHTSEIGKLQNIPIVYNMSYSDDKFSIDYIINQTTRETRSCALDLTKTTDTIYLVKNMTSKDYWFIANSDDVISLDSTNFFKYAIAKVCIEDGTVVSYYPYDCRKLKDYVDTQTQATKNDYNNKINKVNNQISAINMDNVVIPIGIPENDKENKLLTLQNFVYNSVYYYISDNEYDYSACELNTPYYVHVALEEVSEEWGNATFIVSENSSESGYYKYCAFKVFDTGVSYKFYCNNAWTLGLGDRFKSMDEAKADISYVDYQVNTTNQRIDDLQNNKAGQEQVDNIAEGLTNKTAYSLGVAGLYNEGNELIKSWSELIADGDITVSGTTITGNNLTNGGKLIIDNSVTSINPGVFSNCSLTSVMIPNSMIRISDGVFNSCALLTNITIPNSVISIGGASFTNCTSLKSITIPDSVTNIGEAAFYNCTSLTDVYFKGTKTQWDSITIGEMNEPLINATIHYELTDEVYDKIDSKADKTYVDNQNDYLNTNKAGVYNRATLVVPSGELFFSDEEIAKYSGIYNCLTVKYLDGSWSAQYVDADYNYIEDSLELGMEIPFYKEIDGVTYKLEFICGECGTMPLMLEYSLNVDLYLSDALYELAYKILEHVLYTYSPVSTFSTSSNKAIMNKTVTNAINTISTAFERDGTYFLKFGSSSISGNSFTNNANATRIIIVEGVTSLNKNAISGCSSLKEVLISSTVTSLSTSTSSSNAVTMFNNCPLLTDIIVNSKNTNFCDVDGVLFNKAKTKLIRYPYKTQTAFTIPNTVTEIDKAAFKNCTSLKELTISDSLTTVGSYAFDGCSITKLVIADGSKSINLVVCKSSLTSVEIPNSVTSIGGYVFYGCEALTSVTIPNSVISIGEKAFGQTILTSINIPDSVTTIGDMAFSQTKLTSITIPDSVTSIGTYTFQYSYLKSATLPSGITSIPAGMFWYCSSLSSITIPDNVTSIGGAGFKGCSSLTSIVIPDGVTSIDSGAFYSCTKLNEITIPSNTTNIGSQAFYKCTALTNLNILSSTATISSTAFSGCTGLTDVVLCTDFNSELNISEGSYTADVMVAMFNNLKDLTGATAKTLTLGSTNLAKLTDEQKSIATNKNWNLA